MIIVRLTKGVVQMPVKTEVQMEWQWWEEAKVEEPLQVLSATLQEAAKEYHIQHSGVEYHT
jgi:hypothetical protein